MSSSKKRAWIYKRNISSNTSLLYPSFYYSRLSILCCVFKTLRSSLWYDFGFLVDCRVMSCIFAPMFPEHHNSLFQSRSKPHLIVYQQRERLKCNIQYQDILEEISCTCGFTVLQDPLNRHLPWVLYSQQSQESSTSLATRLHDSKIPRELTACSSRDTWSA